MALRFRIYYIYSVRIYLEYISYPYTHTHFYLFEDFFPEIGFKICQKLYIYEYGRLYS